VLWTGRRPRMNDSFHGAKVAVVARVRATPLSPFGDVAVNRAAVWPVWPPPHGDENQQPDHKQAEKDYAVGSPTHRNVSFLFQGRLVLHILWEDQRRVKNVSQTAPLSPSKRH